MERPIPTTKPLRAFPPPASGRDRRRHPRTSTELPCKVLRPALARYLSARTTDLSAGGALLDIATTRPLEVGESIAVGIAWHGEGVLRSRDLVDATVVRADALPGSRQRIAVRFADEQIQVQELLPARAA